MVEQHPIAPGIDLGKPKPGIEHEPPSSMKRLTLAPSSHTIPPSTIAGKSPSVVSTTYETVSLIPFGIFNSVPSMGAEIVTTMVVTMPSTSHTRAAFGGTWSD